MARPKRQKAEDLRLAALLVKTVGLGRQNAASLEVFVERCRIHRWPVTLKRFLLAGLSLSKFAPEEDDVL